MSGIPDWHDFADDLDAEGSDDGDDGEACGRWANGQLGQQCALAGTEFCDWDCPHSASLRF